MIVDVWRYSARGGKLTVCKCQRACNMVDGTVDPKGPSVYFFERDDELARRILVDYEEKQLKQLYQQVHIKLEVIKKLKSEP